MNSEYGRHYRELYERHWWWRARERWILDVLRRYRPPTGWRSILDVGCGDGLFFDQLSALGDVEGVEADASLVSADRAARERIHLVPFDTRFQPGKHYSLILMLDVLEHLSDPRAAVHHARSLLEHGGTLLVTVPAFMALWTTHDELNHHVARYTKDQVTAMMLDAGLDVAAARYFFHWMYPAKLALRASEYIARRRPISPRVPARWINESLYLLSLCEQRTLSRLPMPFGSSLLVMATKLIQPITQRAPASIGAADGRVSNSPAWSGACASSLPSSGESP